MKITLFFLCIAAFASSKAMAAGEHHVHDNKHSPHNDGHKHHEMNHGAHGSVVGVPVSKTADAKVIHVSATDDMKFSFSGKLDIKAGDVVTFVVTNNGKIRHEFAIGSLKEQKGHRKMMKAMPDMVHEDGGTLTLEPGETKETTWQFKSGHKVQFACNIPGHFEAGMHAEAEVSGHH